MSASLAVRENAISKETDIKQVGGNLSIVRPSAAERDGKNSRPSFLADGMGIEDPTAGLSQTAALVAALDRSDLS